MDINRLERVSDTCWRVPPREGMRVPAVIFADEGLIRDMDEKVREQASNVARLPGIVAASYAMPDAHWGYGFPIGGVAAFDPAEGGVVSAGGVGFDISCGVRTRLLKSAGLSGFRRSLLLDHKRHKETARTNWSDSVSSWLCQLPAKFMLSNAAALEGSPQS